ncbi:MAG TPA: substrate-binding domain-containing protein [Stellaceae bacterium]|nr:substrate-binding domain-containing protein [Stellaceae bacterium]
MATSARAESVAIYAAGSLRATVEALAGEAHAAIDVDIKPVFGGSGLLRQRIESGERPDLFLSADLDSPRKLAAAGRTVVPTISFARNRMCVVARPSTGLTPQNLIDRMLAPDLRLRTSTPVADPAGDYAMAVFDRLDALRPGAGRTLRAKAQRAAEAEASAAPQPGLAGVVSLFRNDRIDLMVTYCSVRSALEQVMPEITTVMLPPELDPHPVYAMAVLSARPSALRLALFLLSEQGQSIVSRTGLLPLLDAAR